MNIKYIRPFKSVKYFILANVLLALAINYIFWPNSFLSIKSFFLGLLWSLLISLSQWAGNNYVGVKIDEHVDAVVFPIKRTIYGFLGLLIYSSIAYVLVQVLIQLYYTDGLPKDFGAWLLELLTFILPVSFITSFLFSSIGYFQLWRRSELKSRKLETEMLKYKYESLQNQINPHFLFNSFNVLSELVVEDQDLAVDFIHKMSDLYRYVLDAKSKELVPLDEELDFIHDYIFLLKTRFGDKLNVDIQLDKGLDYFVVPMALQLVVENVSKHNIATKNRPLYVTIAIKKNFIVVENNLQLRNSSVNSTKKGIENLKQQYRFFTNRELIIEQTKDKYTVSIPLLTKM